MTLTADSFGIDDALYFLECPEDYGFITVVDEYIDSVSRWSSWCGMVVQRNSDFKYYLVTWEEPHDDPVDFILFTQLYPKEVTTTIYTPEK